MGTARSLAKLHSLLAQGKLVSQKTLEKLLVPVVVDHHDVVLLMIETKGKGFIYTKNAKVGQSLFFLFFSLFLYANYT